MAELRRLSTHFKFSAFLDEALRDHLVSGLRSQSIQKKLLTEADLNLTKATDLSAGMEAADKNPKSLKGPETAVNRVALKQKACFRCEYLMTKQNVDFAKQNVTRKGRPHCSGVPISQEAPNTPEQTNAEENTKEHHKHSSHSSALCC